MSCQKAMVVVKAMQELFKGQVDIRIHTTDSKEALAYQLRSSTTVFVDGEMVDLGVVLAKDQMEAYLRDKLA